MKYHDFLATLEDCPFCALRQATIAENDAALLTYALAPYHVDHLLVVPKKHVEHILDLTEEMRRDIDALERAGVRILKKLGHENVSCLVREGGGSGKTIPHLHYHLIPDIILGDTTYVGEERVTLSPDEQKILVSRLLSAL